MTNQSLIGRLLRYAGVVCFAIAVVGLVMFIWGSVSPGWYPVGAEEKAAT